MAIPPETLDRARIQYIQGIQITQIAKELNVTQSALSYWRKKQNWDSLREVKINQINQCLYVTVISELEKNTKNFLEIAQALSLLAKDVLNQIIDDNRHLSLTPEIKEQVKSDVMHWAKIAQIGSQIQRNVMPTAQEDISDKMLEEIQKLKELFPNAEKLLEV